MKFPGRNCWKSQTGGGQNGGAQTGGAQTEDAQNRGPKTRMCPDPTLYYPLSIKSYYPRPRYGPKLVFGLVLFRLIKRESNVNREPMIS